MLSMNLIYVAAAWFILNSCEQHPTAIALYHKPDNTPEQPGKATGFTVLNDIDENEAVAHVKDSHVKVRLLASDEPEHEFGLQTELSECQCIEASSWFTCAAEPPPGNIPSCDITKTLAPSRPGYTSKCLNGPVQRVLNDYKTGIISDVSSFNPESEVTLSYTSTMSSIADSVLCFLLPFQHAHTGEVLSEFIELADDLIQVLRQVNSNEDAVHRIFLRVLAEGIRYQVNQKAYTVPVFKGGALLPLYSLRRVVALPNSISAWDFPANTNQTQLLMELYEQLETPNDPLSFCIKLFENLKQDALVQTDVSNQNLNETTTWIESLTNRITISQTDLEAITNGASKSVEKLNVQIEATKSNIEAIREIELKTDLFDSISQIVKHMSLVVVAISTTIARSRAQLSHMLVTNDASSIFEPVTALLEQVAELQTSVKGFSADDKTSLKFLTDAGYPFDVNQFVLENERFNYNVKSLANEMVQLTNNFVTALKEPENDPTKLYGTGIRETEVNPVIWDALLIQMRNRFEYLNVCAERSDSRRLDEDVSSTFNTPLSDMFTTSSSSDVTSLNERRNLGHQQFETFKFERSLAGKDEQERKATRESVTKMQVECGIFIQKFRQLTTIGRKFHAELIELLIALLEYRNAAIANKLAAYNLQHWSVNQELCGTWSSTTPLYRQMLHTQVAAATASQQQELQLAKSQLTQLCTQVDYILCYEEPVCSLSNLNSVDEVVQTYQNLKDKYEEKWVTRLKQSTDSYYLVDVTHLVDMEKVQSISEVSDTFADFAFSLTPNDVPKSHSLNCHSNVEVHEVAIVFGNKGRSNVGESFAMNVLVSGPFLKVQTPTYPDSQPGVSVFFPNSEYSMSIEFQSIERNQTCSSEQTEMVQLCDRKLCRISSGDNEDFADAKLALPSLYATYQVQVAKIGKSGLQNVNSVQLVVKGRSTVNDLSRCSRAVYEECGTNSIGSDVVVSVVIGSVVVGGAILVWWRKKKNLTSSVLKSEQDAMVVDDIVEGKGEISPQGCHFEL